MKGRLKKLNRGIILAIILLIGLTIYIMIDNHNFKSEKSEIENVVEDYVNALNAFNITPEDQRALDVKLTQQQSDEIYKNGKTILDKYWVEGKTPVNTSFDFYFVKSDMRRMLQSWIDTKQGYVTDYKLDIKSSSISKNGPNAAIMFLDVSVKATGAGEQTIFGLDGQEWLSFSDEVDTNLKSTKAEGNYDIYLKRTSDGWKIEGSYGYMYMTNSSTVVIEPKGVE